MSGVSRHAKTPAKACWIVQVIFTPLAERNITDLYDYIAAHSSVDRADGFIGQFVMFCNGLSTFPLRGAPRNDVLPGLRVTSFNRRVTIAYVVAKDTVLIESIFYGGRSYEALTQDL